MDKSKWAAVAKSRIESERKSLLEKLEDFLELPMLVFSIVWLILMILEFTRGLSPFLTNLSAMIWVAFVIEYLLKLTLAPHKTDFIKSNVITLFALVLPALRVLRIARLARILRISGSIRGLRLARILTSLNRGMSALGHSFSRRGFGYVFSLTVLVCLAGAAGMYAFEHESGTIKDYGTALWWTAMILTTMGTDYFPQTAEGRLLCLLLAVYGFAVFGYMTATIATFFVGRDAADKDSGLRAELRLIHSKLDKIQQGR